MVRVLSVCRLDTRYFLFAFWFLTRPFLLKFAVGEAGLFSLGAGLHILMDYFVDQEDRLAATSTLFLL
jgi:hypothetical protein